MVKIALTLLFKIICLAVSVCSVLFAAGVHRSRRLGRKRFLYAEKAFQFEMRPMIDRIPYGVRHDFGVFQKLFVIFRIPRDVFFLHSERRMSRHL